MSGKSEASRIKFRAVKATPRSAIDQFPSISTLLSSIRWFQIEYGSKGVTYVDNDWLRPVSSVSKQNTCPHALTVSERSLVIFPSERDIDQPLSSLNCIFHSPPPRLGEHSCGFTISYTIQYPHVGVQSAGLSARILDYPLLTLHG